MDTDHKRCSEKGFSLIEIAIALVVVGLLIAPFIQIYNINKIEKQHRDNNQKLETVSVALNKYAQQHRVYPIPASPTLASTDANLGTPASVLPSTNCSAVTTVSCIQGPPTSEARTSTGNGEVLMGAVPFKVLGLTEADSYDIHGSKITYAVTRGLLTGTPNLNGKIGAIGIINQAGTPLQASVINQANQFTTLAGTPSDGVDTEDTHSSTNEYKVLFAVISHGADRKGAYQSNGALNPCTAPGLDRDNCNNQPGMQALFRGRNSVEKIPDPVNPGQELTVTKIVKAFSLAPGADFYDDMISYRTQPSNETWAALREGVTGNESIYLATPMKTVIGAAPTGTSTSSSDLNASVTVYGNVKAERASTETLCENGNMASPTCFRVANITGPPASSDGSETEGFQCPNEIPLHSVEKATSPAPTRSSIDYQRSDYEQIDYERPENRESDKSRSYLKRKCPNVTKADYSGMLNICSLSGKGIEGFDSGTGQVICAP